MTGTVWPRGPRMLVAALVLTAVGACAAPAPVDVAPAVAPSTSSSAADRSTTEFSNRGSHAAARRWEARLNQALAELVAMPGGPPGAVAVVQSGSRRSFHSAGVADVATRAAPTIDSHMRIASVAKAFSGAAALALVDEGLLSLDDTIAEHLPSLPAAWGEVTLRQLLNHTSGLPDLIHSPAFAEAFLASPDQAPPPEQLLQFVAGEPLRFPPGTQYAYSNSDNIAVALMIEAVSDRSYTDVLSAEVLRPLGLARTSLPAGIEIATPTLRGYDLSDAGEPEDVTGALAGGWAWASGGIVSTPADLNTFIRAYVRGDLYRERTRAQQQSLFIPGAASSPPGPGDNAASLALFRYRTSCGTMYGHTGNTFGYTQFAAASSSGRRSAVVAMSLQRTDTSSGQALAVFQALQQVEQAAACVALHRR